ncbi:hypothetical protein Stsp02_71930 [Streptomyces sp. NBRC 14336]|nr:hypothetical protein Stsp02_71930 [Streptomyces sp. NBRC 14336]
MLEGYPCSLVNRMEIARLLKFAEGVSPSGRVHLIEPEREYPDGTEGGGGFGPVELIPPVACVGVFRSTVIDPAQDPVLHRSRLTVAWFQRAPQAPSGDVDDHPLRALAWEDLAEDYEL